jgi:hypothetical protein
MHSRFGLRSNGIAALDEHLAAAAENIKQKGAAIALVGVSPNCDLGSTMDLNEAATRSLLINPQLAKVDWNLATTRRRGTVSPIFACTMPPAASSP